MLADGREFQNVQELKALLLEDQRQLARNLLQQLMVYATSAPMRFSDRPIVEDILTRTASDGYGARTLIHEIVQSKIFQHK